MTKIDYLNSNGLVGEYTGRLHGSALLTFFAVLTAIAVYNAMEVTIVILVAFKRYKGLYFWSLILSATVGVIPYSIGFMLKFFGKSNIWVSCFFLTIGWWVMVTGQSLILYSRLHLVLHSRRTLRNVLLMIIINVFILHVPTTICTFGSNVRGDTRYIVGYGVLERIQLTGFCIQEFIISGLYIYAVMRLFSMFPDTNKRKLMNHLLAINVLVIIMDVALLATEFANLYAVQIMLKGVVYSVKIKLELAVLSNLVDLVSPRLHHSINSSNTNHGNIEIAERSPRTLSRFKTPDQPDEVL